MNQDHEHYEEPNQHNLLDVTLGKTEFRWGQPKPNLCGDSFQTDVFNLKKVYTLRIKLPAGKRNLGVFPRHGGPPKHCFSLMSVTNAISGISDKPFRSLSLI